MKFEKLALLDDFSFPLCRWIRICWFKLSDRENLLVQVWYGHSKAKKRRQSRRNQTLSINDCSKAPSPLPSLYLRFSRVWMDRMCRFRCSDRLKTLPHPSSGQVNIFAVVWTLGWLDTRRPRDRGAFKVVADGLFSRDSVGILKGSIVILLDRLSRHMLGPSDIKGETGVNGLELHISGIILTEWSFGPP